LGDGLFDDGLALVLIVVELVVDRDAAEEVDDALEGVALADGDLNGDGRGADLVIPPETDLFR